MCHPDPDRGTTAGSDLTTRTFTVSTGGADLPVFQATPAGESRGNVVILHDIYGANQFYHDLARRFASVGYTAYLPDLFVRQGPFAEQTSDAARARGGLVSFPQAMDDLSAVVDALQSENSGKVGMVGFCMGGTLVMLMAAREPRFSAGVIYYGFPANPNRSENRPHEPIEEAAQVQVPLLGFWGDQDRGVGMDNVEAYRSALSEHGKEHDFTIYPGLPHGFLTFDASSPNYEGSQDSWERMLAFYGERLA